MIGNTLTVFQHTVFDILLPTSDVFGDINFAISAFSNDHPFIGSLMIFPVLVNIFFNLYKWSSTDHDTQKEKQFTWILALFNLWPQYQVVKLLLKIFRGKSEDVWKPVQDRIKKELSYIEPFIEAIPQLFVQMCVFVFLLSLIHI